MSSTFVDKPGTKFTEKKTCNSENLSLDWLFADNLDLIDFMQELQNKIHITLCYIKPGMVDIVLFQCN